MGVGVGTGLRGSVSKGKVKKVVFLLEEEGLPEKAGGSRAHRRWGRTRGVEEGPEFDKRWTHPSPPLGSCSSCDVTGKAACLPGVLCGAGAQEEGPADGGRLGGVLGTGASKIMVSQG